MRSPFLIRHPVYNIHNRNPDVYLVYSFHGTGRIPCGSLLIQRTLVYPGESAGAEGVLRYLTPLREYI